MTILKKIGLSKRYGKAIYAISAVLTLAISSLVFFNPYAIPMAILLKLVSIPIILYLYTTFTKKTEIYFYLNLGISRNEYNFIPFVVKSVSRSFLRIACHQNHSIEKASHNQHSPDIEGTEQSIGFSVVPAVSF